MTIELTRLSEVQPEPVSWLWPGRIPVGKLVTLDGDPGVGKSTLALSFAATITTGGDWPDGTRCTRPGAVVVMSAEDGLGDTIRPRLDAAGADTNQVHALQGRWVHHGDERSLAMVMLSAISDLRAAITATGAHLLIVDVLMAFLADSTNSYRDQDMRKVLTPLANLAAETGCTIMLLRHPPKGQQTKAIHAGGGSIGIIGAARVGMLAVSDTDDDTTRVLTVTKNNLAPIPPSLAYQLDTVTINGVDTALVRWIGEHHASATELVTALPDATGDTATVLAVVNARTKTTAHDVVDAYPHITLNTARRVLSRLSATEKIERETRGVYCPIVRLSEAEHIASSDHVSESDIESDTSDMSETQSDNRTLSETLSDMETTPDQPKPTVSDNRTTGQVVMDTTPTEQPPKSATDKGNRTRRHERHCQEPDSDCNQPVHYAGRCRYHLDMRSIGALSKGVAERSAVQ